MSCCFRIAAPSAQCIQLYIRWSLGRFSPHTLNYLTMTSFENFDHDTSNHSTIFLLVDALRLWAEVYWWIPSLNHASYSSVSSVLKGLFHDTSGACKYFVQPPEIITESILLIFKNFLIESIIWHSNESHANKRQAKDNFPKTVSTYLVVSFSFIQPFNEDTITQCFRKSLFNASTSRLSPPNTIKG